MKKRGVLTQKYCKLAQCELCRVLEHLASKNVLIKEYFVMHSVYGNMIVIIVVLEDDSVLDEYIPIAADRLAISHYFSIKEDGLTALVVRHKMLTMDKLLEMTEEEVKELPGVGRITMIELRRILFWLGWKFKDGPQPKLFSERSLPTLRVD